jgi:hypothetical protein
MRIALFVTCLADTLFPEVVNVQGTRAEVCTVGDSSCLMHIGGGLSRLRTGVRSAQARHVEEARRARRLPSAEAVTMAAAAWVMADPGRYTAAQRAGKPGRALSRGGRIRALPPPLSAWTRVRDAPAPPAMTFRECWRESGRDSS